MHLRSIYFFKKRAKNDERTASSINNVGKTGYPPGED
jgi:hypothetical protein